MTLEQAITYALEETAEKGTEVQTMKSAIDERPQTGRIAENEEKARV